MGTSGRMRPNCPLPVTWSLTCQEWSHTPRAFYICTVNKKKREKLHKLHKAATHRLCNRQEAVVANEDDVEDRRCAEKVVHDQPELAQSSAQHPPACECVRDVGWNAECTFKYGWQKRVKENTRVCRLQVHLSTVNESVGIRRYQTLFCVWCSVFQ